MLGKFFYILLALGFTIFGFSCKNTTNKPTSKPIELVKMDSFNFDADSAWVEASYPVFNDTLLNSKIQKQILQYCKISLMTNDNSSLENAAKDFAKQGIDLRKEYPETPLGKFYAKIKINLHSLTDSLISMSMHAEYYMGGELPIQNALGLNYVITKANFLPSNAIVQNENELHQLATVEIGKNQQVIQAPDSPTDKIAFSKDSIFLYYRGADVSVEQIVEVRLPRSAVKTKPIK